MNSTGNTRSAIESELQSEDRPYRADTDAMGRWFVWERLGPAGWVTVESCLSREEATRLADQMNLVSGPAARSTAGPTIGLGAGRFNGVVGA